MSVQTARLLTSIRPGAISTIELKGDRAVFVVQERFIPVNTGAVPRSQIQTWLVDRPKFGKWRLSPTGLTPQGLDGQPSVSEEVVVCRLDNDCFEVHCHGGLISQVILADLYRSGWEFPSPVLADLSFRPPELNRYLDELLAKCESARVAAWILRQRRGVLAQAIEGIDQLLAQGDRLGAAREAQKLLRWRDFGMHWVEPWQVAIVGKPNAGKSSLLNQLLGFQRAIVHAEPGTTRDRVTGLTSIEGWPVQLVDTAGIRETQDPIEAEGVRRSQRAIGQADLVLWVVDRSAPFAAPFATSFDGIDSWKSLVTAEKRVLLVENKSDLPFHSPSRPEWEKFLQEMVRTGKGPRIASVCPISAQNGDGIEGVVQAISDQLVPQLPQEKEAIACHPGLIQWLESITADP